MGGELVSDSLPNESELIERGRKLRSQTLFPYTEIFNKQFPYYLSIGMTEEQFWERDCTLVKYYREAEEIKKDRENQMAWLQGMYVYDAIARVSPILKAFGKKGTKAQPYVSEPYPISKKAVEESQRKREEIDRLKAKRFMETYMASVNKFYETREEVK